ncbi:MAG: hypothetical protein ACREHD_04085 [Pirellulales bacterium]
MLGHRSIGRPIVGIVEIKRRLKTNQLQSPRASAGKPADEFGAFQHANLRQPQVVRSHLDPLLGQRAVDDARIDMPFDVARADKDDVAIVGMPFEFIPFIFERGRMRRPAPPADQALQHEHRHDECRQGRPRSARAPPSANSK